MLIRLCDECFCLHCVQVLYRVVVIIIIISSSSNFLFVMLRLSSKTKTEDKGKQLQRKDRKTRDNSLIIVKNGVNPMCYREHSAVLKGRAHSSLDELVRLHVNRCRGLVHDEDLGLPQHGTHQAHQLSLAHTKHRLWNQSSPDHFTSNKHPSPAKNVLYHSPIAQNEAAF